MYSHNDFEKQAKERPYYAVRCCDLLHAPAIFFSRLDVAPLLEHDRDISMDYKACETMLEAFEYIVCDMLSPTKFPSRPPAATAATTDISLPKSASSVPINFTTRFTYAYNLSPFLRSSTTKGIGVFFSLTNSVCRVSCTTGQQVSSSSLLEATAGTDGIMLR